MVNNPLWKKPPLKLLEKKQPFFILSRSPIFHAARKKNPKDLPACKPEPTPVYAKAWMQDCQAKPRAQLLKEVPKITTLLRRPSVLRKVLDPNLARTFLLGDQIFHEGRQKDQP